MSASPLRRRILQGAAAGGVAFDGAAAADGLGGLLGGSGLRPAGRDKMRMWMGVGVVVSGGILLVFQWFIGFWWFSGFLVVSD